MTNRELKSRENLWLNDFKTSLFRSWNSDLRQSQSSSDVDTILQQSLLYIVFVDVATKLINIEKVCCQEISCITLLQS